MNGYGMESGVPPRGRALRLNKQQWARVGWTWFFQCMEGVDFELDLTEAPPPHARTRRNVPPNAHARRAVPRNDARPPAIALSPNASSYTPWGEQIGMPWKSRAYRRNQEEYVPENAMPLEKEIEMEMAEVLDTIDSEQYVPQPAESADRQVESEIQEVLDTIEAEQYVPLPAESVDRQVESEIQEVLDTIEAEEFTAAPNLTMDHEIDEEIREVMDAIDSEEDARRAAAAMMGRWRYY